MTRSPTILVRFQRATAWMNGLVLAACAAPLSSAFLATDAPGIALVLRCIAPVALAAAAMPSIALLRLHRSLRGRRVAELRHVCGACLYRCEGATCPECGFTEPVPWRRRRAATFAPMLYGWARATPIAVLVGGAVTLAMGVFVAALVLRRGNGATVALLAVSSSASAAAFLALLIGLARSLPMGRRRR